MESSRIRVLSDHTINKIAAGEVIENPSSVVKELVENSLDAGAKHICVEIKEGGRQLIRITDDGCGMNSDDALLCLERHATSKIREVEDIQELFTMGFRGEALPSIASISKLTILTCPNHPEKNKEGTLVIVEGGRIISHASAPRSSGTTIEVNSLFFNVPVRRKFQKSPQYDVQEILKMIGFLALAYPAVQFELMSDQKTILKTPLNPSLLNFHEILGRRLECVLGKEISSTLIPLKFQKDPYELQGYIGSPSSHRPNRTGQHLFINQRLVGSPLIASTIREAYGPMLPNNRYPVFVIHLRLPGDLLDVNVHPQKKEVRLRQESQLKEAIIQSVQVALRQENSDRDPLPLKTTPSIPPFWGPYASLLSASSSPTRASEEPWVYQSNAPMEPSPIFKETFPSFIENEIPSSVSPPSPSSPFQNENDTFLICPSKPSPQRPLFEKQIIIPRVIATIKSYSILEPFNLNPLINPSINLKEGGLALLDQQAAYSRVHYEKLLKDSPSKEIQPLLIPLTLQLTPLECDVVREHEMLLNKMGFEIREFGEQSFVLDAYPSFLKHDQLQTSLQLLIQDLVEMQTSRHLQIKREEKLALAACRATLPSAKCLSIEEAQGLVKELMSCEVPAKCPMGKPTCMYFSPEELEKWFNKTKL